MLGGIPLTVKTFAVALANSLIAKGIDKETAVKNVLKITRALSEDDYTEIAGYNSADDFVPLTEALTKLIEDERRAAIISDAVAKPMVMTGNDAPTKQMNAVHNGSAAQNDPMAATKEMNAVRKNDGNDQTDLNAATKQMDAIHTADFKRIEIDTMSDTKPMKALHINDLTKNHSAAMAETKQVDAVPIRTPKPQPAEAKTRVDIPAQEMPHTHYTEYQKTELTKRGAGFFWTIFALTLPLTLLITIVYFGIFALCVVSVAALIVGCFIIVAGIVIAGSIAALIGLIYGVIQMFTAVGIGIYEIGVAIVVSGLTVILSVLVYLLATRVLPYLLKQLIAFTRHTLGQIPGLVDRAREECNKL